MDDCPYLGISPAQRQSMTAKENAECRQLTSRCSPAMVDVAKAERLSCGVAPQHPFHCPQNLGLGGVQILHAEDLAAAAGRQEAGGSHPLPRRHQAACRRVFASEREWKDMPGLNSMLKAFLDPSLFTGEMGKHCKESVQCDTMGRLDPPKAWIWWDRR